MTQREKLIEVLAELSGDRSEYCEYVADQLHSWWNKERRDVFDTIVDMQPTIDAVEVVRCKDCVCAEKFPYEENVFKCTHPQWSKSEYGVYGEDYCSYGERKGGDE